MRYPRYVSPHGAIELASPAKVAFDRCERRYKEPAGSSTCVHELHRTESGPRPQVGQMALRRARPNPKCRGNVRDGSAALHVESEDLLLPTGC
jgi:hypothetical protein